MHPSLMALPVVPHTLQPIFCSRAPCKPPFFLEQSLLGNACQRLPDIADRALRYTDSQPRTRLQGLDYIGFVVQYAILHVPAPVRPLGRIRKRIPQRHGAKLLPALQSRGVGNIGRRAAAVEEQGWGQRAACSRLRCTLLDEAMEGSYACVKSQRSLKGDGGSAA
jgi:hypothetical protein